ncbi:MAG: hypothetical protein RLO09_19855 [Cyclobacteriaceae bacterium]
MNQILLTKLTNGEPTDFSLSLPLIYYMNAYYKTVGLTLVCFVAAFMLWWEFLELSINQIKSSRMIMNTRGISSLNSWKMFFAVTIGSIPLLHLGIVKLANIRSTKQKVISLAILLTSGIALWQGRLLTIILRSRRTNSILESTSQDIHFEYPINELQPQLFIAIGLFIGTIANVLIFRTVNRRTGK